MKNFDLIANEFAKKYNVSLSVIGEPKFKKYFTNDTQERYVFKLKLKRNGKKYTFNFGQSLRNGSEPPEMYDVLACLTKYDIESYNDFIKEYGWDYGKQSYKTYKAVCKEYEAVCRLFNDVIEELREIN